jgi:hypothetical protein
MYMNLDVGGEVGRQLDVEQVVASAEAERQGERQRGTYDFMCEDFHRFLVHFERFEEVG